MKRSANEILAGVNPVKSSKRYDTTWNQFKEFINKEDEPGEDDFIQYFDHLKQTKGYASSSIWSFYSMINHKFQMLYGKKLQKFPRITHLLKSYEVGYERISSNFFSKEQLLTFLETAPNTGEFIHIKAAVVIGYCGGLRSADLININVEDCEFNETTGVWISYTVSKQRGEKIVNKFNVPLDYCEYLEKHDNELFRCSANKGRLFKS